MQNHLKSLLKNLGIDKSIIFTSSTSVVNAIGNILTMALVVKTMTLVEQGFYFTFGSIIALQVFFELGLNGILVQYVAHEFAHLKIDHQFSYNGPEHNKSRLASLLRFSLRWYFCAAIFLTILLIIIGYAFFSRYSLDYLKFNWLNPWIFLVLSTSLNLFISPCLSFLQGIGKIKEISHFQFYAQIIRLSITWIGLFLGFNLYVLGLSSLIYFLSTAIFLHCRFALFFKGILLINITDKFNYLVEIFPFQWRIALSWISGYFIFQLFNPVIFASEGAAAAGKMGITLAALNGIFSISFSWINTKVPAFSKLVALKDYQQLDILFNKALKQSTIIIITLLLTLFFIILLMRNFRLKINEIYLADRFLNIIPLIFMMVPILLNHFVSSWAAYLRCHKIEAFSLNSIIGGILCTISTLYLGKHFGISGITVGYLIISVLMFPWSYYIFKTKKNEWHL